MPRDFEVYLEDMREAIGKIKPTLSTFRANSLPAMARP
jgi:hypothetical protein